jgi:SpoVK/Ycf46/Vps4 family AAA+-type ATPase
MISVRPGEWRSQWYGESERYLREMFGAARSAGEKDRRAPVVVFFDELDSIGTTRGRAGSAVDDRVLQAFAAELDGVLSQRNHNILMIGATNRRESLDPALLRPGRFGDKEIRVGRPGMSAARAILAKHLTPGINYALNGSGGPSATRDHIIDATVSRLYAPNGESDLCSLIFRDGSQRPVKPADLMSGASLAKIAHAARERACWREVTTHSQGVRIEDLFAAVDRELDRLSRILTPANAREHLVGLPDDLDVVKVERSGPRHARGRLKYLTISGA